MGGPEEPLIRSIVSVLVLLVVALVAAAGSVLAQAPPPGALPVPPGAPSAEVKQAPSPSATPAGPLSRIQGTVILSRRNPVVGATVLLTALEPPQRVWVTATDDRGEFQMEGLPEGTYRLETRRSDLQSLVRDKIALKPPFRAVVELTMQPAPGGATAETAAAPGPEGGAGLRVSGKTVDREGKAIPESRLRWVDAAGRRDPQTLQSGEDGSFVVQGLPAGTWRLEVLGVGFLPVRVDLPVAENTVVTAVLVRQSASHEPLPLDLMPPEEPIPPPEPKPEPAAAPPAGAAGAE